MGFLNKTSPNEKCFICGRPAYAYCSAYPLCYRCYLLCDELKALITVLDNFKFVEWIIKNTDENQELLERHEKLLKELKIFAEDVAEHLKAKILPPEGQQ